MPESSVCAREDAAPIYAFSGVAGAVQLSNRGRCRPNGGAFGELYGSWGASFSDAIGMPLHQAMLSLWLWVYDRAIETEATVYLETVVDGRERINLRSRTRSASAAP